MLIPIVALVGLAFTQDDAEAYRKAHVRLYSKVSPAIVGVRSPGLKGSGVIIHKQGWIITSIMATGMNAENVWVYLKGHKRVQGQVVQRVKELELAIVKIEPDEVPAVVELGDSESVRVGQISYVLGDSFESIFTDDQVAISLGRISGTFENRQLHERAQYKGPVIETTAAVNPGADGAALVDGKGRLLGLVTMNYNEAKFTGLAIPLHKLKEAIEKHVRISHPPVWSGFTAEMENGKLVVTRVSKDGPGQKAGLKPGDVLLKVQDHEVRSGQDVEEALKPFAPGESVRVLIQREGKETTLTLVLEEKEFY
jgi:S1-C subfamily serine protease